MDRYIVKLAALLALAFGSNARAGEVQFNRDIRPILSDRCFACHGPDDGKRKAGLRLDRRESATTRLRSGSHAIVAGKPEAGTLVARILSAEPEEMMPPPRSNKTLTPREKDLLKRWIAEGAEYQAHWSYIPPKRPSLPNVKEAGWVRNPIDRFILARLEQEGLRPSPEADRATLIRRLTLDLTGLPPTPAEVDVAFADSAPDAYEKLVDRLLASPRYGEKMASHWLDAARYADTHGYQTDQVRFMWPWRDWVVDAFNSNLSFDRFTIDQIAGDLLPDATPRQKLATGFNRNHRISEEGGIIEEELRVEYVIDRVATTSTVWLGLTMACAQCHDHKFDSLTQKDYYRFFAFFNSVTDRGNAGQTGNAAPTLKVPTAQHERQLQALRARLQDAEAAAQAPSAKMDAEQTEWEKRETKTINPVVWDVLEPASFTSRGGAKLTRLADQSILADGTRPNTDVYEIVARTNRTGVVAIQLEALPDSSLPGGGPGRFDNSNFVLSEFELEIVSPTDPKQKQKIKFSAARASYSQPGFEIAKAIDGNPQTGWAVDGPTRQGTANTAVFVVDKAFGFDKGTELRFAIRQNHSGHQLGRVRLALSADPHARSAPIAAPIANLLAIAVEKRTNEQKQYLRDHYRRHVSADGKKQYTAIEAARKQVVDFEAQMPSAMVMQDLPKPRDSFVLIRGQYDKPGEKVTPGVPAALWGNAKPQAAKNRLDLGNWLVDPTNPLTARVAVNGYWQQHFGTGLVRSAVDFGVQGEWPSHPELLDWLAVEFQSPLTLPSPPSDGGEGKVRGWDVKAMQRLIVTSAAYRQSAKITPALLEKDPDNRLLARGPRFRLSAEEVRDGALAMSGLLVEHLGGPPVKPYQPAGLWEELTFQSTSAGRYQQDRGLSLHRRSMYTFWKRTIPPPSLSTLDAPTREFCSVNRPRTNTPLQALVLMNDPTYVEAARVLAQKLIVQSKEPAARLTHAFRLATGRTPSERELAVLLRGLERRKTEFAADRNAALRLLSVGETARDDKLDATELAAYTAIVSVILNLDECITRE